MERRVLVIGATGVLGEPVARQLQADGFMVRALARHPEKAAAQLGEEFEIVPGDVADLESLQAGMQDCWGVHITAGGPVEQISAENVAKLAPQMGVERIGYVSGTTVDERNAWFPMVQEKLNAEKAIKTCGVAHLIFRPTWPMEMLAKFVRDGRATMLGKNPHPYHWFAAADYGRMVSNAFQKEADANHTFFVHGPEAIYMQDAMERYCKAFHPEIEKVGTMPVWMGKLMSRLIGSPELKFAANLMGYFEKVPELGDPAETNALLGAPTTTLDEWIVQRK
ncbi:MAG: NAD(P)H-binding protein [Anaerolineales bacterium]|nr:NAD(P)H-binding protein [Anaerolineales bacterium]